MGGPLSQLRGLVASRDGPGASWEGPGASWRSLEPAGRLFEASWEAQSHLGGPAEKLGGGVEQSKKRRKKTRAFLLWGGTISHCSL